MRAKTIWVIIVATMACETPTTQVPEWSVEAPYLSVGGVTEDEGQVLNQVVGATLLSDGRLVVADRYVQGLRQFDTSGALLRTAGGEGQGPGEFQFIRGLGHCDGGNIVAFDLPWSQNVYDDDLSWIESRRAELPGLDGSGTPYRLACEPGGHVVATAWGNRTVAKPGYFVATGPVVLVREGQLVHEFGERLSSERYGTVNEAGVLAGSGPHPFGRETEVAISPEHVFLGDASDYSVEVYDLTGSLLDTIRWDGPSREITGTDHDRFEADALDDAPVARRPALRRSLRRFSEARPRVEAFPAYDELRVDDAGNLWVRSFLRPGSQTVDWLVLGIDGRVYGRVHVPTSWTLLDIVGESVVYVERDELGVETVQVARMLR